METVKVPSHVEVDVRRQNGIVETITIPGRTRLIEREFAAMVKATREAGRGEVLAYRNIEKDVPAPQPTAADLVEEKYRRDTAAIYRASAGGEPCDDGEFVDNTPAHKRDDI